MTHLGLSATGRSVQLRSGVNAPRAAARGSVAVKMGFDIEALNQQMKDKRLKHLEDQSMEALKTAVHST